MAGDSSLSVVILALSHVLNCLIAEKLRSHSEDVTGSVHPSFRSSKRFGYWISSHFLMALASMSRLSSQLTVDHFFFHNINSWSTGLGFGRSLSYILTSSWNLIESSSQIIEGTKHKTLPAIQCVFSNRTVISEIIVSRRGMINARLYYISGISADTLFLCTCLITVLGITGSMHNLSPFVKLVDK